MTRQVSEPSITNIDQDNKKTLGDQVDTITLINMSAPSNDDVTIQSNTDIVSPLLESMPNFDSQLLAYKNNSELLLGHQ